MVLGLAVLVLLSISAPAVAQPLSVAVVSLDGERDRSVENEVAERLASGGLDVYVGEELQERLDARRAPAPVAEVSRKFSPMTTTIAAGVERFFYKGNEAAIETISPMFDLGMAHPEVLARRPDFADQIFSAGVVLIRAYHNLEETESMLAVARLLVKTFPAKTASPTTVPPKVIKLLDEERGKLAKSKTQLSLMPIESSGCTTYLNGTAAEGGVAYSVDPQTDYFFRLDCGAEMTPVWTARIGEGEQVLVPLTARDPMRYTIADGDFSTRKVAENHMAAIAYWGGLEAVVGVSRAAAPTEEGVLLVRLESDGTAQWSDGVTERSVQRAIARVFPELTPGEAAEQPAVSESARAGQGLDVLGVSLVAGGVASIGTGSFLLLTAQRRARILLCSNLGQGSAEQCAGVERLDFSADEFSADQDAIRTRRIFGWSILGAGVALSGWGLVRLLRGPGSSTALYVAPSELGVVTRFR